MTQARQRWLRGFALGCVAVLLAALVRVWLYHEVLAWGYKLSDAQRTRQDRQERLQALEVEQTALRSPARLQQQAARLHMRLPRPEFVVALPAQKSRKEFNGRR